jgi:hypothetical protein
MHAEATYVIHKHKGNEHDFVPCEKLLGESIRPFMAEVYLVDPGTMARYIYTQRDGNLGDLLASSAETLRRPDTLRYAKRAAVDFDWDRAFIIALRMEFVHESLRALFDLVFDDHMVGIDILGFEYRAHIDDEEEGFRRFARAVADICRPDA